MRAKRNELQASRHCVDVGTCHEAAQCWRFRRRASGAACDEACDAAGDANSNVHEINRNQFGVAYLS